jgi:hypothetical protein
MLLRNFFENPRPKTKQVLARFIRTEQQLNRHKAHLNREKTDMKNQNNSVRQTRSRTLIQAGGLLSKSGLMDAFDIQLGEDLQDYESLPKAARLLGFLHAIFESQEITEQQLTAWQQTGERLLRYGLKG